MQDGPWIGFPVMTVGNWDSVAARPARPASEWRSRCFGQAPVTALLALCACSTALTGPHHQDSPPAVASVRDGIGADLDRQEVHSSLFANWDPFIDPEGRAVIYEWSVGTSPGAIDVMPWTGVGGATQAVTRGVDLPVGIVLHVNVRAFDIAGNRSAVSTSDGVVIGAVAEATTASASASPAGPGAAGLGSLAAVERFGITWTFDRPVASGRFVNGDWWVLGPVDVVAIKPHSLHDGSRIRHGSVINPDPRAQLQGYDNAMFGAESGPRYDAAANVGLGISSTHPLHLLPGSSLVSTTSQPLPGQMPQLEACAVLTCLAEPPPVDAFRPPYCGTDKRCRWVAKDLDLTRLARLEAPPGVPSSAELLEHFERTWLDHVTGWTGRFLHPRENMPDYGRDIADLVGQGALVLQLDQELSQKRPLAIAMVQIGIDLYGVVKNGGRFLADGGSGSGRKFPVLLAGALLRDEEILRCVREQQFAFAEDAQTFVIAETTTGVWNFGHGGYGPDDVGLPEWGNRHADDPSLDVKTWTGDPYRRCCTANVWHGAVLAVRIMGLREAWGHDPLFDYVDRYMQVESKGEWTRSWNPFAERMWDRYRSEF